MDLIKLISKHAVKDRRQRYRDRRGHYASSALKCLREQYWELTGVPKTNPTDLWGHMKMSAGNWIEAGLVNSLLNDLHWYGLHVLGTQVQVGGSNPDWDGALDVLAAEKVGDEYIKKVVEIKTKSGMGADLLISKMEPSVEYLAQMGLYLSDLSEKQGITEGMLLYKLLSDKNFGHFVQIDCKYDPKTKIVTAYRGRSTTGEDRKIHYTFNVGIVFERWKKLDEYVAKGIVPPADYKYKYPVTPELLANTSDAQILKVIDGKKVIGDWQVAYSGYKQLHLDTDGVSLGYTEAEINLFKAEYKKRHPRSKKAA